MNISVFGLGYVGMATCVGLAKLGHTVVGVDVKPFKVDLVNEHRSTIDEKAIHDALCDAAVAKRIRATSDAEDAVLASDVSMICVGTPAAGDGGVDLQFVTRVSEQIGRALQHSRRYHVVVVRSTVFPGTTEEVIIRLLEDQSGKQCGEDFGVCANPEFLREGSCLQDFLYPEVVVIGTGDDRSASVVRDVYKDLSCDVICLDIRTAEMVKYASNAFHAVKVSFANEIGNLCQLLGVDGRRVMEILCLDRRLNISPAYLKPGFAFGGSCLSKDLQAMITRARDVGYTADLLITTLRVNDRQIEKAHDLVRDMLGGTLDGRRIAVLGLTFKEGTDDLRDSATVRLASRLLQDGVVLSVHEESVHQGAAAALRHRAEWCPSPAECMRGADLCIIGLAGHSPEVIARHLHLMRRRNILNLRNHSIVNELESSCNVDFDYRDIVAGQRFNHG